jgi:hypothetical protein
LQLLIVSSHSCFLPRLHCGLAVVFQRPPRRIRARVAPSLGSATLNTFTATALCFSLVLFGTTPEPGAARPVFLLLRERTRRPPKVGPVGAGPSLCEPNKPSCKFVTLHTICAMKTLMPADQMRTLLGLNAGSVGFRKFSVVFRVSFDRFLLAGSILLSQLLTLRNLLLAVYLSLSSSGSRSRCG